MNAPAIAPPRTMVGIFGRPSPSAFSRPWIGIGVCVSRFVCPDSRIFCVPTSSASGVGNSATMNRRATKPESS